MKKFIRPFLYIISLIACCIEIDISVPSFPDLVKYFHTTESLAQHTVSINFLGFFLSALIVGPLSDAYGRRPIMIIGNGILMIGALGCIWAPTIATLLFARFIQGVGAATSAVVVFTMIADTQKSEKATHLIAVMNCILTCLMAIAPIAGSYLNQQFGWRGNYIIVAIVCVFSWILLILLLSETQHIKQKVHFKDLISNIVQLLKSTLFLKMSFAPSLLYGAYLSFITSAPFLYMQTFKLPILLYALHQAFIVTAFALISLFSSQILKHIGKEKCANLGIGLTVFGTLIFLTGSLIIPNAVFTTITVSIFAIGAALFYPVVFSASLEIFPNLKGSATSLIMSKRAIIVATATATTGYFYNDSPVTIAIIMGIIVGITQILSFKIFQTCKHHTQKRP